MSLKNIIMDEILSIHDDENFGKEELEKLEDIELFHLFTSKIRRDAWERGFQNGYDVGSQESLNNQDGIIKLELDILDTQNEENQNND
jgi:hypothetical protein